MFSGIFYINNKQFNRYAIYGLLLACILFNSGVIYSPFIPKNIDLEVNDIAVSTITSPRYLEYESKQDRIKNIKAQTEIRKSIPPVYSINQTINNAIIENIQLFFDDIASNSTKTQSITISQVLTETETKLLKETSPAILQQLKSDSLSITNILLSNGIKQINKPNIKANVYKTLNSYDANLRDSAFKIVIHYIQPNLTIDQEQTNLIIKQALNSQKKQKTVFKQGQPIIYEGERVSESQIEVFKALNMYHSKASYIELFGIFIFCFLGIFILERFIHHFYKKAYSLKYISITLLVLSLMVLIGRLSLFSTFLPVTVPFYLIIPISISSMLLTFLVSSNISMITGTLISFFISIMFQMDFNVFVFLFLNTCFATFTVFNAYKRSDLLLSGYFIGCFNVLCILGIGLLSKESSYAWYGYNTLFAFGNGVFSAMITLAILPYFEFLFKITTNQTLLELANLNHPLLKRLMMDAPGTYQHSLMVANLSEAAAEAIGANNILCRVGSYFHDIGKLKRPVFFSENQFSQINPHETIAPRMSKMIIISHVKEGVDLALKHKLPAVLKDLIEQHHGTSLLSVFYTQAISKEGDNPSTDNEFRYPGPKPQTKEAGILMLADSVEAATRSIEKGSPQKIENMINKIFKEKLDDLQLSECPLSLNEIFMIKSTFLYLFKGIQHNRVDYEQEVEKLNSQTKSTPKTDIDPLSK
jgi:putative nucleotidyltransferase with HDIG domain